MPVAAILPIVAVAATAAGTALQMTAASDQKRAMQDALDKTLIANRKYQQQATAAADLSAQQSTPAVAKKEIGQGAQNLESAYKAATSVPITQPGQSNAPTTSMVPDKGTKTGIEQSNQARATLGGYNEWALQQWIKDLQATQKLQTASTLARMTTSQLPYQLAQAQQPTTLGMSGQGVSALGNVAGAVGTTLPGGLWGAFKPAPGEITFPVSAPKTGGGYGPN